jgi:hypothetical protein
MIAGVYAVTRRSLIAGAGLAGIGIASLAGAQAPPEADTMTRAFELVAKVEQTQGCDISLHGTPRLDDLTNRWLVAYSGVGPACDDLGAALQREGIPAEISFYRRPNDDELMALIGRMRASVRQGYACQIAFKGEPQFDDETDLWNVRYYASGQQCEDASDELERQGKTLRVAFRRVR